MMQEVSDFNNILKSFNIKATCVRANRAGGYFFYDLKLNPNARIRDIQKYGDEISLALKAPCKPGFKVIREEGVVRLEFISPRTSTLRLFDYFTNDSVPKGELNCLLGQTVDGQRLWMDLAQNPHMLVSGTTGSGKSVLLHNIIANVLNYNNANLFLVDPKTIEFDLYKKINGIDVRNTYDDAVNLINSSIELMEFRYSLLRLGNMPAAMKPVVIIIDEFADLILQDKNDVFYTGLCRLAQKCRAAKIHIILATQRPSVNIINGVIKANFPARIACRVVSQVDSKVILDSSGAENLLGKGDALVRDNLRFMERFQVAYTDAAEVCSVFGA